MVSEGESLTGWGREFQRRGATREKARSPKCLSLDGGTMRGGVDEDRRVRVGRWRRRRSVR